MADLKSVAFGIESSSLSACTKFMGSAQSGHMHSQQLQEHNRVCVIALLVSGGQNPPTLHHFCSSSKERKNTQRLISVKTVSELPEAFKDKVSFQVVDNKVEAVIFTIGEETLRVVVNGTYSNDLKILTQQPKKQVTRYKLSGSVGGLVMQPEMFDQELEADEKRKSYEYKFDFDKVDLKIEPVVEFVDEEKI